MHQLSLLIVIIVVISGALCEDAVVLMAECPRSKLLNMNSTGKVFLSPEGPPTPNITFGGRIIKANGTIKALTTLYFNSVQRYLCIDKHGRLRGELHLNDNCYFFENDVRGKYEYRLWLNETFVIQFRRKNRNPPCSEFHKVDSKKYHSVPISSRASSRLSFPNDSSLSILPNGGNDSNAENRHHHHRHGHGNQRKQVNRRRMHQRKMAINTSTTTTTTTTTTTSTTTTTEAPAHSKPRDRSKTAIARRKHHRGKKHKQHHPKQLNQKRLVSASTTTGLESNGHESIRALIESGPGRSITNKNDDTTMNSRRKTINDKRRSSYSNVNDEYSNDEPSAIVDTPMQNSLTDFLNPSTNNNNNNNNNHKKYHIRNWLTSSILSSSISKANSDGISRPTNNSSNNNNSNENNNNRKNDDNIISSSSRSSSSSSSSHSHSRKSFNINSGIASSHQNQLRKNDNTSSNSGTNKTAHFKSPAVLRPEKMRRLRSRLPRNYA